MLTRSPLKRKRETPRRNEGRIKHVRVKPKVKAPPTAAERRHMDRIARMPCLGCGARLIELHHSLTAKRKIRRRDHRFVIPLCAECHRGDSGVHGLGSEALFGERIGIDLGLWAVREWERSCD